MPFCNCYRTVAVKTFFVGDHLSQSCIGDLLVAVISITAENTILLFLKVGAHKSPPSNASVCINLYRSRTNSKL